MDDRRSPVMPGRSQTAESLRLRLHPGGHLIDLIGPDMLVGRHSDADIRLPQPDVSRQHCRFHFTGSAWHIVDLDSINGVFVNGARVRRVAVIRPGDVVRICSVEFEVEMATEAPAGTRRIDALRSIAAALPEPTAHRRAS